MNLSKRKALMKTFVISQFNYCLNLLVRMFHSRKLNHRINGIYEWALKVTYRDHKSTFFQLLQKDISVIIHHGICKFLLLKFFLQKNDLSPEIMKDVFELKEPFYSVGSKRNYFVMKCEVEKLVDFNLLIF